MSRARRLTMATARASPPVSAPRTGVQKTPCGRTRCGRRRVRGPSSSASHLGSPSRGAAGQYEPFSVSYFVQRLEAGPEPLPRCSERGTHDDLEDLIVAVRCLDTRDVIVGHFVRVAVNLVHERLQVGGSAKALGGSPSYGRIAFAGAVHDAVQDSVA